MPSYAALIQSMQHFKRLGWKLTLSFGETASQTTHNQSQQPTLPQPGQLNIVEQEQVRKYYAIYERYDEMKIPLTVFE